MNSREEDREEVRLELLALRRVAIEVAAAAEAAAEPIY